MSEKKRIYQIDLFRFLAALAVVLFHYTFRGYAGDEMSTINFNAIGNISKYGYLGVNIFFIISGFVILLSIKQNSLIKFIISRFTRLYPTYWIAVSLTFVITLLIGAPRYSANFNQFIFNLTMFQNYMGVKNIDGAYWSLFVEMKFYIFIVCTYLILNKIKRIKLDHLIIFWLLLSILYLIFNDVYIIEILNFYLILNWSSYFISGIIFYQIFTRGLKKTDIILLFICLCISLYHGVGVIKFLEEHYQTDFSPFIICSTITLFYFIMYLVATGYLKKLNSPKLLKLGLLTYPLYLIHQNIGFILFNNLNGHINKYVLLTATILLMIFISYLLSKFYEPKIRSFLHEKINRFITKFKQY